MTEKRTERVETEQNITELTIVDGNIRNIVQWKPQEIALIYGFTLQAVTPTKTIVQARQITDVYTKAKAEPIDDYLNKTITLCGGIMHMGTVKNDDKEPIQRTIDVETGEVEMTSPYTSQYRQVFKVCAVQGEPCKPFYIKFMSRAIEEEYVNTFYPMFGPCDWSETVDVQFIPVSTGRGRTYNIKFV
jgi:hypothetical protein